MNELVTQEKIDALKAKLILFEGDKKAYSESALQSIAESKKRVSDLRANNAKLRNILCERLSADYHIINHVMENRPTEKACFASKSGSDAFEIMDYRICNALKKINLLKHKISFKEKKIEDLKCQYRALAQRIQEGKETWSGINEQGKKLRDLENRLDKAQLKYHEAEHIKKTYEQIKLKLQDEYLIYESSLDELEKQIKDTQKEISELQLMYNDAVYARNAAQQELCHQEKYVTNERIRREVELNTMKKIATGRKDNNKKIDNQSSEKHSPVRDSVKVVGEKREGNVGEDKVFEGTNIGISEDQETKIAIYEEAFRQIKEATGLSDLDQIVKRFENQNKTLENLNFLKTKAEKQCQKLRKERDDFQLVYEKIKYSGETDLVAANQLLQQYCTSADEEAERRKTLCKTMEDMNRLLVECKTGVDHIFEKLNFLSTRQEATDSLKQEDSHIPEMLKQCNNKLDELMASLHDMDIEEQLSLMQQEDFLSKLEGKIPEFNIRIQLPVTQRGALNEDDDTIGDDNEFLTRAALKKQAEQILEMRHKKRQTKKKKKKK